jgi:hypothetical protein
MNPEEMIGIEQRIIHDLSMRMVKEREEQILNRLNDMGFAIDCLQAAEKFAKERLTFIVEEDSDTKRLYVDYGKDTQALVASFTTNWSWDLNNDRQFKVTVTKTITTCGLTSS